MKLVIECLQKELERQELLMMYSKAEEKKYKELPGYKGPPQINSVYPNIEQFRNELETAIAILKTENESSGQ